ncbi:FdtA/QdtA family cupin domain-containing protein [Akkermansiaceae bacterium]|nr:FdtA/QdtA family cupin domain-containing protein [Akkermansiaceae bacterium]
MLGEIINLQALGDSRGGLVVAEAQRHIPFEIKRVYWIHGTQSGVERGFHAHKALHQVAVAVSGSCDMILDDGKMQETVRLDSPEKGVFIGPGVWRVMKNFTSDCVLLVFADAYYDENDYIRDYEEFKTFITTEVK